jgi:hypothetical protein
MRHPFPDPADQLDPDLFTKRQRRYSYRLNAWMCSKALSLILEFIRDSGNDPDARPSVEWIADRVDDATVELGRQWLASGYDYQGSAPDGVIVWERTYGMATSAAEFALREYDPEKRERWARGGAHSRRGPNYTVHALRALPEGLTAMEQARELGCSIRTVRSLRAQL